MKKLFVFILLLGSLGCYGLAQTDLTDEKDALKSTLFTVSNKTLDKHLDTQIDTAIVNFYQATSTENNSEIQARHLAFLSDSGLYSGFGTAWHRKYGTKYSKNFDGSYETEGALELNYNLFGDLFGASTTFISESDMPLIQSAIEVSIGYRNFF